MLGTMYNHLKQWCLIKDPFIKHLNMNWYLYGLSVNILLRKNIINSKVKTSRGKISSQWIEFRKAPSQITFDALSLTHKTAPNLNLLLLRKVGDTHRTANNGWQVLYLPVSMCIMYTYIGIHIRHRYNGQVCVKLINAVFCSIRTKNMHPTGCLNWFVWVWVWVSVFAYENYPILKRGCMNNCIHWLVEYQMPLVHFLTLLSTYHAKCLSYIDTIVSRLCHTQRTLHIHIYMHIYMCVCACVCVSNYVSMKNKICSWEVDSLNRIAQNGL